MVKITFNGAAQEVGRSAFLVDDGDKILLDYGVKLTPGGIEYPLPVKVNLNAAIISHAHLDHTDAYLDVKPDVLEAMFAGAI